MKAKLLKRDLSTKGNKKELAERLIEAVEDEGVEVEVEDEVVDVVDAACEMEEEVDPMVNGTFTVDPDIIMTEHASALVTDMQQEEQQDELQESILDAC